MSRAFLQTQNNLLVGGIAQICAAGSAHAGIVVRIQHVDGEVTVVHSCPSPVDVEHTIAVVTVNDKFMTTTGAHSTEDHGATMVQFVPYQLLPSFDCVMGTVDALHGFRVAEVAA